MTATATMTVGGAAGMRSSPQSRLLRVEQRLARHNEATVRAVLERGELLRTQAHREAASSRVGMVSDMVAVLRSCSAAWPLSHDRVEADQGGGSGAGALRPALRQLQHAANVQLLEGWNRAASGWRDRQVAYAHGGVSRPDSQGMNAVHWAVVEDATERVGHFARMDGPSVLRALQMRDHRGRTPSDIARLRARPSRGETLRLLSLHTLLDRSLPPPAPPPPPPPPPSAAARRRSSGVGAGPAERGGWRWEETTALDTKACDVDQYEDGALSEERFLYDYFLLRRRVRQQRRGAESSERWS